MKIELKLLRAKAETPEGFMLIFEASHQGKRKQKCIGFCKEKHFLTSEKMISTKHPDYDILAPEILNLKLRAKKIILKRCEDVNTAMSELFEKDNSGITFSDAVNVLFDEVRDDIQRAVRSKDQLAENKLRGSLEIREYPVDCFNKYYPSLMVKHFDANKMIAYRKHLLESGKSKTTVHLHLRTLKTIYREVVRRNGLPDTEPFKGVLDRLKTRSYATKKKHLDKQDIKIIESANMGRNQRYIDVFLLQFYFGGADLLDIYFMKKEQLRNGRVFFVRGKLEDGMMINLKVHPKAQAIIDRHKGDGPWLFPWSKDRADYIKFRRRVRAVFGMLQSKRAALAAEQKNDALKLEVKPMGGTIASKVARHTFANLGKRMGIEEDLLRELMGHQRDDIDNHYKDLYPEEVRDKALYRIIE